LFIDLNGFKGINDAHGHGVGDRVLEIVARRLRGAVRPEDEIGRLGGDEFVVVAPGLPSLEAVHVLAARVSDEVNGVATVAGLRVDISASIGGAWADSGDPDVLLAEADRAMYLAKCARDDTAATYPTPRGGRRGAGAPRRDARVAGL
jgi:diguanylate cyclase (GGDEF)-like protein